MFSVIATGPGPSALTPCALMRGPLASTPAATPPAPTVFRKLRRLKPGSSFRLGMESPLIAGYYTASRPDGPRSHDGPSAVTLFFRLFPPAGGLARRRRARQSGPVRTHSSAVYAAIFLALDFGP